MTEIKRINRGRKANRQWLAIVLLMVLGLMSQPLTTLAETTYLTSLDQVTTGYYRIYSLAYGSTMAMSETKTGSYNVYCDTPDENDYMQVWYIELTASQPSETTKNVQIKNAVSGRWIDRANNNWGTYVNHSSTALTVAYADGYFTISRGDGFHHQQSGHDVVSWSTNSDASKWKLEKVTIDDVAQAALDAQKAEYNGYISMVNNKAAITTALNTFFTDGTCSTLKDAYKSSTDDNLTNDMKSASIPEAVRSMALKVKNNTWTTYGEWRYNEKTFRIGTYKPVSKESRWRNLVKVGYALSPNSDPTGICVKAGDIITVYVGTIPSGGSIVIRNVPARSATGDSYTLTTGFNALKMQTKGYLFVDYEVDNTTDGKAPYTALTSYPDVSIHIEGGIVHGAFSTLRGDTNEDWANMKTYLFKKEDTGDTTEDDNYLQLRSEKLIFNMKASLVKTACPTKMRELLEEWDKIVRMEHNIMGLDDEFGGCFNTPMMAVSFTGDGHMYASTYGTYYKESTLSDVMSYENLFAGGSLWGPAHEIGHINQAAINIIGQSEVSNNVFSNIAVYLNGHLTSRAAYASTTFENMANNVYWQDRGIWERTHLYFQLYQFFHVQGYKTTFYQDLFKALRADPCTRVQKTFIDATDDYLKFYKKACEVSGYDLTEFFQAYGFFIVPNNKLKNITLENVEKSVYEVGDYGTYYLVVTQAMIEAAIAEVKGMTGLKKANIVFIEDRVSAPDATYTGVVAGTKKTAFEQNYLIGKGDVGQYTDFNNTAASGYKVLTLENGTGGLDVSVNYSNASGAVGFKVYDNNDNLVYLSNTYSFTIPKAIYDNIKNDYKIMAAGADGADLLMEADDGFIEWVVKDGQGNELKKYFLQCNTNTEINAYPSALTVPFVALPALTTFTFTSKMTKEVVATVSTPFKNSTATTEYYYNIKVNTGYIYQTTSSGSSVPELTSATPSCDTYCWAFYGNPYDGYRIKNLATGQWLSAGSGDKPILSTNESTYWVITKKNENGEFFLSVPGKTSYLNDAGGQGNNLKYYSSADGGSTISVSGEQSITLPTVTINTTSYLSSFSYPSNLVVPDDVNIFTVTSTDVGDNTITVQWLDTKVIPANTGVLLYCHGGGQKTLSLGAWVDADVTDLYSSNLLKNTASTGFAVTAAQNIYALKAGFTAFARVAAGVTIPVNKAYLDLSSSNARELNLDFGNTTGIKVVLPHVVPVVGNYPTVDLQGRVVSPHYKGIIISNGKKIIQR